ncbi:hypothetical protein [Kitasatospora sp. GP82]|uniref:hypothetical protein n=1 Tax=Kitasatospora sp. GP82 TaxID=3035089 RepID=UPI0024762062|nr:hypothetical protein [Kitasatospora sp. GP82]MDH6124001.1 hypothetical protein [Kitasatospora sp. GP82]
MNTDLLYDLLDVDPRAGAAELLVRARRSPQLPYLVLSSLAREDARMGEPARAELRRAQARADRYAEVARRLGESTGVRPIRGLPLARYYPPDLLRPQGDLDLIAPSQSALWRAAARLVTDYPIETIDVTVLGDRPRHLKVALFWPAADPLVDPWYRVELCTAALAGDLATVPVRPVLAADDHVECLIALAEKGLQRPFQVRDVVDVLVLSGLAFDPSETAAVVSAYRLAPEAARLLDVAAAHVCLGSLAAVRAELAPEIGPELRRRERTGPEQAIVPRRGVLLRRTVTRDDWDEVRYVPFGQGELLLTPVADYLLAGQDPVPRERREAALAALHAWDAAVV